MGADSRRFGRIRGYRDIGTTVGQHDVDWLIEQLAAAQSRLTEIEADANRYRYLRRKVCIIQRSGFMGAQADKYADFELINFPKPTYMAPDAACELDAAIDQQITDEEYDALAYN